MEGISSMLNPFIKEKYINCLITDLITSDQYDELISISQEIEPTVLITDAEIPQINEQLDILTFNFNSIQSLKINDQLYLHNDKTIHTVVNDCKNILVTDNLNNQADLYCLLGPKYMMKPMYEGTWFGKINGKSCMLCGGQPTNRVIWWTMLLFDKFSNKLRWGFHSMAWGFPSINNNCAYSPKYNKNTIFEIE